MNEYDKFSASASNLGYEYQIRFALLSALQNELDDQISIETYDDVEIEKNSSRFFLSLKHKKVGGELQNKSVDFWKSVNIWLKRYKQFVNSSFYLITTEEISNDSLLINFLHENKSNVNEDFKDKISLELNLSKNKIFKETQENFNKLTELEKIDFLRRITIFNNSSRITEIPEKIKNIYLAAVSFHRVDEIYERLEGWWYNKVVECMSNNWEEKITKKNIILKINEINEEYFRDSLPLIYNNFDLDEPTIEKYLDESYIFIQKVKSINLSNRQIIKCISDFYKATNERNNWIKKTLVNSDEIINFEKTLIDEWERFRDNVFDEELNIPIEELVKIGKQIFNWSQTVDLHIRPKVTEKYICRGTFHIIADDENDRLHWLPK